MAQNTLEKQGPKRTAPSRKGLGPTSTSWKPGQSGNPGGRPRKALAAVEKIREKVDPAEWVDAELATARDLEKPWDVRRDAWRALIDRGFVRAPASHDVNVSNDSASDEFDFSKLSTEELAQLVALQERARASDPRLAEPEGTDEEQPLVTTPVTEEPTDDV